MVIVTPLARISRRIRVTRHYRTKWLKENLQRAQNQMKLLADRSRREVTFVEGDWVYVKLQPFRQHSIRLQRHHKLSRRYFGPHKVIGRVGEVAYRLELLEFAHIHPVFHVSLLKKCLGQPDQQVTPLYLADSTSALILQPTAILEMRSIQRANSLIEQWLVQWDGSSIDEATWEDKAHMMKLFPDPIIFMTRFSGPETTSRLGSILGCHSAHPINLPSPVFRHVLNDLKVFAKIAGIDVTFLSSRSPNPTFQ